ncbi:MAG: hypothetical protein EPO35_02195 [Acidobacteria bacterium]|nr:MAG: hypothetical protein EPO35_02195 [Acidobacteriota bacterium]
MKVVHTLLLASLAAAAGCGSDTTTPTPTTVVETFASRIQEKGSAWRSINVPTAGDVTMQLVTMSQADTPLNLGIGTISGTQCVIAASVDTVADSSAVKPQLTRNVSVGTYCVRIADIGKLTQTVDFSIRIEKPL